MKKDSYLINPDSNGFMLGPKDIPISHGNGFLLGEKDSITQGTGFVI